MNPLPQAWLLTLAPNIRIAVAETQMLEYLLDSPPIPIPLTPAHCSSITFWRHKIVPLLNINKRHLNPALDDYQQPYAGIQILHYQHQTEDNAPPEAKFIGIPVQTPPERIKLANDEIEAADKLQQNTWRSALISSFKHENCAVSVVDFSRLVAVI
ncbi:MAG: hypothetical protein COB04_04435 [Gammaproteobacteria bacterium]|nr:MAG: hypothetical protein COB04_04435 [Gammaproteobacteria bacterium]